MKYIILFIVLTMFSCSKTTEVTTSDCMLKKIEEFKLDPTAKAVLSRTIDGEKYFWLNTNATHYDGVEYIYNNNCKQICSFCGECFQIPCDKDLPYDKEQWVVEWKL